MGFTESSFVRQRLADQIRAACIMEATARKPGNVHPLRSFFDLTYQDFVDSADAVAPILASATEIGVGQAVRDAVAATQERVGKNTNLGIILLLAPLAAVPSAVHLVDGSKSVLAWINVAAMRIWCTKYSPDPSGGGMGASGGAGHQRSADNNSLVDVMRLAADRDRIARQYSVR